MIGFPLQLPIEATADREIVLAHINVTVSQPGLPTLIHDHMIQLRMEVTAEEATALRAWLVHHAKGIPPMVGSRPDTQIKLEKPEADFIAEIAKGPPLGLSFMSWINDMILKARCIIRAAS